MMQRYFFLVSSVFFLLGRALPAFAYDYDCSNFLKLSASEQRQYLVGYTLGVVMEMQYFKNILGPGDSFGMETQSPVRKASKEPADNPDPHNPSRQLALFRDVTLAGVHYLDEKDVLISIAAAYPKEFHEAVQKQCKSPGFLETGMFDILPSTLRKMKETGKYRARGM